MDRFKGGLRCEGCVKSVIRNGISEGNYICNCMYKYNV